MEIPLSFFVGFGSGVPVQSHSSFVNGCILAWVGGLRLWKKRKRIVCFRETKMPSTLSICRVDLRQCALIKKTHAANHQITDDQQTCAVKAIILNTE
jgi:hypothetical protein